MPIRRIVQDSDDEDSLSVGNISPEKLASGCGTVPNVFNVDSVAGNGDTAEPGENARGTAKVTERNESTGSTERLSREINSAHETLLDPSPDPISAASHADVRLTPYASDRAWEGEHTTSSRKITSSTNHLSGSYPSFASATPSKPKRRHSDRKPTKTYGNKTTVEVFGAVEEGWNEDGVEHSPKSSASAIIHQNGGRRTISSSSEARHELGKEGQNTLPARAEEAKRLQRRATTHGISFLTTSGTSDAVVGNERGGTRPISEGMRMEIAEVEEDVKTGLLEFPAATCTMKELELQHFGSSTEPLTSEDGGKWKERAPTDRCEDKFKASDSMMTSWQSDGLSGEGPDRLSDKVSRQNSRHDPLEGGSKDKESSYSEIQVTPLSKNSSSEILTNKQNPERPVQDASQDDSSLLPSRLADSSSPIRAVSSKKKKKFEDLPSDGPESDDFAVGLPPEQYKPRPSRSRAHRAVDDLSIEIDYSKRPETVAKNRAKRRKTAGDVLVDEEDREIKPMLETNEDRSETNEPAKAAETVDLETTNMKEDTNNKVALQPQNQPLQASLSTTGPPETVPKKKRGRPKKQIMEPNPCEATPNVLPDLNESYIAPSVLPQPPTPAKINSKKRKRSKTEPAIPSSPIVVDSDSDSERDPDTSPRCSKTKLSHPQTPTDASVSVPLSEKSDANVVKQSKLTSAKEESDVLGGDDCKGQKLWGASPAAIGEGERSTATPLKKESKGPDRPSPLLHKGGRCHRVGLSRKAPVQSLLKIVRK